MYVGSVLIEFYSKCGQMGEALRVFKEFSGPDVGFDIDLSLVNSLLNLYAKTGPVKIAAKLYRRMPEKDVIS
ncbi:pentatricopeptide repeat-containing protein [Quercus suber]|uniref:Pentatricopeptide repeat-containing protein n=1 Tax=Quercus suber TaxID=58331 RepID=A0AAW0JDZ7_QUESU